MYLNLFISFCSKFGKSLPVRVKAKTAHFLAQLSRTTFSLTEIHRFCLKSNNFFLKICKISKLPPKRTRNPEFLFFLQKKQPFGIPRPLGIGGPFSTPANHDASPPYVQVLISAI